MTNTDPAQPKDPLVTLWKLARVFIADAVAAFGQPGDIAALIARKARHAVRRRIKALETLVMKLLLIEASKLKIEPEPTRRRNAAQRVDSAIAAPPDLAKPETWRVRFALRIPAEARPWTPPASSGPRIRSLNPPLLVRDIWRDRARQAHLRQLASARIARFIPDEARERAHAVHLARRFEALRRVVADPVPRARLLLRKLDAMKKAAYEAIKRIALRLPPREELYPGVMRHAEYQACYAIAAICAALPALNSS
jgi:hypothetical protein